MPKRILEDIVRVRPKGSGIPPKIREVKPKPEVEPVKKEAINHPRPPRPRTPGTGSRHMLWFVAFISAVFCFFALSFLFSSADISVNPRMQEETLNENFSAAKNSPAEGLSFDTVVISGEQSARVSASGEKDVAERARGTVVIYNAFGSASQTLDIDTRLEGSNEKIYKTEKRVVVPGSRSDVPGSVEIGIYAAEAGVEYNSGPLDFKIVGFKGTPKYTKFYARSKGDITGGFKGKTPAITEEEKAAAVSDMKALLKAKLLQRAGSQIPAELILFKDAIFFQTDDAGMLSSYNQDNSATLSLKGTLYGILFSERDLTKKIAKSKVEKYDESEVYIPGIKNLEFSLMSKDTGSFGDVKNITFNLSGPAKIVWKVDTDKFTRSILGRPKKDFKEILSQHPNIESADLNLTPMWKMSIPEKAKEINVKVNYPQ